MRRIAIESEAGKKDNSGLNEAIWVPTIDLYLTDIVMQGCSNDSKLVVSPSGTIDKETVRISVSGDSEQDVKSGASVAAVLNKWRTQIIDEVFAKGNTSDTGCPQLTGSKKETAAEISCRKSHQKDYQAQLKCLSGTAGMARAAPMHDCLANWLQTVVGNATRKEDPSSRGPGFEPQDLRKSFGELFQKTVGDFFQVKVAQFLNDTTECFTCEDGKCATGSVVGTFGRTTYRPYAENPNGPTQNGLLVAADAFYKTYKRPILASTVQLNTFDVMAGLIGLQQSANVVLQTIAKTTRSPGTALYGISNLSAPVRGYIETKLATTGTETYGPEATAMEEDDDGSAKPSETSTATGTSEEGDEDGGAEKEVDTSSLQTVEIDVDLISVVRKTPTIITDLRAMVIFLNQNRLAGSALSEPLQKTYAKLASDKYEPETSKQWVFTLRLMFDFLCYYKQMRAEEALARAKVITYIMRLLQSRTPAEPPSAIDQILSAFVKTVETFKGDAFSAEPELDIVVAPKFPAEFARAIEKINAASKGDGDPFTVMAFNEIIDLMQKSSGDKKISQSVDDTDEATDRYTTCAESWLKIFEKVNMQNREMEAVAGLMKLSGFDEPLGERGETVIYEGEETSRMQKDDEETSRMQQDDEETSRMQQDDEETDPEAEAAASALLAMTPPLKRQRKGGGSRRNRKRLPKHRTIRKHSGGQKTLTQVLKELTLGI
jgi:hypothetical protein